VGDVVRRGIGEELGGWWWWRCGDLRLRPKGRGGCGVHKIVASTRERDPQRQRLFVGALKGFWSHI